VRSDDETRAVPPILELEAVSKRFGATVTADRLSLRVAPGSFFTFLGPSGSGKSTILRMIAGLERPDTGRILIDGRDVAAVPPWRRNLGMVFQHYAVFPHMRVAENVAYGLRVRRAPRASIERRVDEMLELVGLPDFHRRDASTLSGGEQQRVALARALAPAPRMLLLDEPLSALDDRIRRDMQSELKHIQRRSGTTFLYVTHDQEEALTMSDRIAVLDRGVCAQDDTPEALFRRPRNRFVASFFRGCNVIEAEIKAIGANRLQVLLAGMPVDLPLAREGTTAPLRLGLAIRCENLRLGRSADTSPLRLEARLEEIIYRGTNVDHVLRLADGQKLTATSTRYELGEGATDVVVGCDPADLVPLDD
jgi:ABC-type Fe3+/spermidine/putrescine transport system ATPase subunit